MIFTSALKCKKNPPPTIIDTTEKLPPATQEGKNTCGFLLNSKVWIPKGNNGRKNLSWYYDPGLNNGSFNLTGYRYEKAGDSNFTDFVLSLNNFKVGNYKLNIDSSKGAEYGNSINYCFYRWRDTIINHNSFVNITKFDTQNRIIAGTFEYTLYKPGCDTVRITQGRFDVKY
jgi:hypothetical protein